MIYKNAAIKAYSACSRVMPSNLKLFQNVDLLFHRERFTVARGIFAPAADRLLSLLRNTDS